MSTIQELFQQAQLSEAAYANFIDPQAGNVFVDPVDIKIALIASGFSKDTNAPTQSAQAAAFIQNWRVVSQFSESGVLSNGLSATLFEKVNPSLPGTQYTLAFRGSQEFRDFAGADLDLTVTGVARNQLISMVNCVLRLQVGATGFAQQLNATGTGLAQNLVDGVGPGIDPDLLTINGHSLGGYLAQVYQRVFGSAGVFTYNALGVIDPNASFFNQVTNLLGLPAGIFGSGSGENVVVPGEPAQLIGTVQGKLQIQVFSETQSTTSAHRIPFLADSLALYDLFANIDPALNTTDPAVGIGKITGILKAASNNSSDTLERTVNALVNFFGLEFAPLEGALIDNRDALYQRVVQLQTITKNLATNSTLQVDSLVTISASNLANLAEGSEALAYRYALKELNPFAILGNNDLYAAHNQNGELDLYNTDTGTGTLTAQWISDRAKFLGWKVNINSDDRAFGLTPEADSAWFEDRGLKQKGYVISDSLQLAVSGLRNPTKIESVLRKSEAKRVFFGSDALAGDGLDGGAKSDFLYGGSGNDRLNGLGQDDYLQGDAGNDVLSGGADNDILSGGKDDDVLDGGIGNDTYNWNKGDGFDIITDAREADGLKVGTIQFLNQTLAGNKSQFQPDNPRLFTDQRGILYALTGAPGVDGMLTVTMPGEAGGLRIEGFRSGDFGIFIPVPEVIPKTDKFGTVDNDLNLAADAANQKVFGLGGNDRITVALNGAEAYGGTGSDFITNDAGDQKLDGEEGNDILIASDGNDELYGGLDNDALQGGADDDYLESNEGDDVLDGGPGSDVLSGGDGNDFMLGGGSIVPNIPMWNPASPPQFGVLVQAGVVGLNNMVGLLNVEGDSADVLDGGAGNDTLLAGDGDDYLDGAADDDLLVGQAQSDTLYGDDGNDILYGDGSPGSLIIGGTDYFTLPEFHGDDYLDGGAGDDFLAGDGGSDELFGGADNDTLVGDANNLDEQYHGADYLDGGAGNDSLLGYGKDDTLFGGEGDDILEGDSNTVPYALHGSDYLDGGDGTDKLQGDGGSDTLFGGAGDDQLFGDSDDTPPEFQGDDYLDGEEGDDYLRGYGGNDMLFGGDGNDLLLGEAGDDYLDGGAGIDALEGGAGDDTYVVDLDDEIFDTEGANTIVLPDGVAPEDLRAAGDEFGGEFFGINFTSPAQPDALGLYLGGSLQEINAADFTFRFADGRNVTHMALLDEVFTDALGLDGGLGGDYLRGYGGNDMLSGSGGNDLLHGGSGDDTLSGGVGNDILQGDAGVDALLGGVGDDTYIIDAADTLIELTGEGIDAVVADADYSLGENFEILTLVGSAVTGVGNSEANLITGNDANNVLIGLAGDDTLSGGLGDDQLRGGEGADRLEGGAGADTLVGGAGNDILIGGGGDDTYVFNPGDGADAIDDVDGLATISFGSEVTRTDLSVSNYTGDDGENWLQIDYGAGDTVSVKQGLFGHIGTIRFADGSETTVAELVGAQDGITVSGSSFSDTIYGTAGDDLIDGMGGTDWLYGGSGNDVLRGGGGAALDFLYGEEGDDTLDPGPGGAQMAGGTGNDTYMFGFVTRSVVTDDGGRIRLKDNLRFSDLRARMNGNDLILSAAGAPELLVQNYAANSAAWSIEDASGEEQSMPHFLSSYVTPTGAEAAIEEYVGRARSSYITTLIEGIWDDTYDSDGTVRLSHSNTTEFVSGAGTFITNFIQASTNGFETSTQESDEQTIGRATNDYTQLVSTVTSTTVVGLSTAQPNEKLFAAESLPSGEKPVWVPLKSSRAFLLGGNARGVSKSLGGADYSTGRELVGFWVYPTVPPIQSQEPLFRVPVTETAITTNVLQESHNTLALEVIRAGASDNTITIFSGYNAIDAGAGNDTVTIEGGSEFAIADWERDAVLGSLLYGNDGDDTLIGGDGADFLIGAGGADILDGRFGPDRYSVLDENSVDIIRDSGNDLFAYKDQFYSNLGIDDWRDRDSHGGQYFVNFEGRGYFNSLTEVSQQYALIGITLDELFRFNAITFIEPLPVLPRIAGNDYAQIAAFIDQGLVQPDMVVFDEGVTLATLQVSMQEDALFISTGQGKGLAIPLAQATDPVGSGIERFEFADGTVVSMNEMLTRASTPSIIVGTADNDVLNGTAGDDMLIGGVGDDVLAGGAGNDTYLFDLGGGVDTIQDNAGVDTLAFGAGITPDMLTLGLGSLLVQVDGGSDAIHVEGFDPANVYGSPVIENFTFAGGTVLAYNDLLARGFDLTGTQGDDVITGTNIEDRINGLAGNDTLIGGAGSDTYFFGRGSGFDMIEDQAGNLDTIVLGEAITPEDLTVTRVDDVLSLRVNNTSDELAIYWQPQNGLQIEKVQFADGTAWDAAVLEALANRAPAIGAPLAVLDAAEDASFAFTLPSDAFLDPDANDTLTFSATLADGSPLPAWLAFDGATFSGTPDNADVGSVEVEVTATDRGGLSVADAFMLNVANINDAPVLINPILKQWIADGGSFNFELPADTFNDIDAGDTLSYAAAQADGTALPAWLAFDAVTRTFSGMPDEADIGTTSIIVTARDGSSATVSDSFDLTVTVAPGKALIGTGSDDLLASRSGNDTLDGLAGDDALFGRSGNDRLTGGLGDDLLVGGKGDDTYVYRPGDGLDMVVDEAGSDAVAFGTGLTRANVVARMSEADSTAHVRVLDSYGNEQADQGLDVALGVDSQSPIEWFTFASGDSASLDDLLIRREVHTGTRRNDVIRTGRNDDTIYAERGNDVVYAGSGHDMLFGDRGRDVLYGEAGNDALVGDRGKDKLYGGSGDDMLEGGRGSDLLDGGTGFNTYMFERGFGDDRIASSGGSGALRFGAGITARDLSFKRRDNDLVVKVHDAGRIRIEGWFNPKTAHPVERAEFADGTVLSADKFVAKGYDNERERDDDDDDGSHYAHDDDRGRPRGVTNDEDHGDVRSAKTHPGRGKSGEVTDSAWFERVAEKWNAHPGQPDAQNDDARGNTQRHAQYTNRWQRMHSRLNAHLAGGEDDGNDGGADLASLKPGFARGLSFTQFGPIGYGGVGVEDRGAADLRPFTGLKEGLARIA